MAKFKQTLGLSAGSSSDVWFSNLSRQVSAAGTVSALASVPPPTKVVRSMSSYGQSTDYYCGPASAYNILKYQGITKSKYNDNSLTQANLANDAHMKTTTNGGTPFDSNNWTRGINRFREGKTDGYYIQFKGLSNGQLQSALILGVDQNMFMGASTVEFKNGSHYNNHPNKLIGHWITTYGYASSGATTYFADPSYSLWEDTYGVKPRFTASTNSFNATYLQTNGVAW